MNSKILSKVYSWMFLGLFVTFLTGFIVCNNENMVETIYGGSLYIMITLIELALVVFLSLRIRKMNKTTARISFLLYSFVTGLTFSSIFISYELSSIISIFLVTSIVFGIFSLIGKITKIDLNKLGTYLLMSLVGMILCVIINVFLQNSTLDLILSVAGVLIFIGFTAYDTKKILEFSKYEIMDRDNLAIYGALELYLDFINIFLDLLNLAGNHRD